jgi:hypothetical protein
MKESHLPTAQIAKKASESWIASLYVFAFIRAALAFIAVGTGFSSAQGFLDVAFGIILGMAAYERQLWAGYGLILHAALGAGMNSITHGVGSGVFSLLWVALYTTGTIHLFRSKGFTSLTRLDLRFIFRWVTGIFLIGFLAGFLRTFNPAFLESLLGAPGSPGRFWSINLAALLSSLLAKRLQQDVNQTGL